jgi:2-oxo-4-hydroxy-4-carboxy-5-ureidoimidazoline decarboxylase
MSMELHFTCRLADVNTMTENEFMNMLSACFIAPECATFALRSAFAERPFASRDALFRALASPLFFGDQLEVVALMRDVEPLGNRRDESNAAGLSESQATSNAEHAGAGMHLLTADEFALCADLNRRYRDKHGFTFIIRVAKRTKAEIFEALARRLENTTEDEFAINVRQYTEIIGLRLKNIVRSGGK